MKYPYPVIATAMQLGWGVTAMFDEAGLSAECIVFLSGSTYVAEHARLYVSLTHVPDCVREMPLDVYLQHAPGATHPLALIVGEKT